MSERLSGRITNVWTEEVSTTLAAAAAVSATTLTVDDASIFNDDTETDEAGNLGYLRSGGQVVGYTDVDDETGVVTLADPLTVAADEDDTVTVWSDLYGEPDTRQWASVQPEGDDRADDIDAIVDDGLELVDGDRGKRGEACTLFRETGSDVWEVRGPLGRPKKARGMKAEANDAYTLTAADVTAGTATIPLSHAPVDESVKLTFGTVPQEPTNYTVDYDAATITFPLEGWESAGLRFSVHYWYVRGPVVPLLLDVPIGYVWNYATNLGASTTYAQPAFDDSAWASGPSPFGWGVGGGGGIPAIATQVGSLGNPLDVWCRIDVTTQGGDLTFSTPVVDNNAKVYLDGVLIWTLAYPSNHATLTIACAAGDHVIAIRGTGDGTIQDYSAFAIAEEG